MLGNKLCDLTDELSGGYIKQFTSMGPKDYSMKLDNDKIITKCKNFRLNAEVEEKLTMDKKIKLVTDENESYETILYNQIGINRKERKLKNTEQIKMYDCEFDKRMIYYENEYLIRSLPYGY